MTISKGLEGVVVDETAISDVLGEEGRLIYRGYAIEDLIDLDFEEVAWLVLFGELPNAHQAREFARFLNLHADPGERDRALLAELAPGVHSMRVLQGLLPLVEDGARGTLPLPTQNPEAATGLVLIARLGGLIAARRAHELERRHIAFDPDRSYLANLLRSFTANDPTEAQLKVFNVVQILQLEHSFNASTFACRVAASTLSPVASALSAAVGTLYGRLHGGADQEAMEFALGVGAPERAAEAVAHALRSGEKIMGMGHREYRVVDPRAVILKPMAARLCRGTTAENLFATLESIERAFHRQMKEKGKEIYANLEFYKGPVYQALGIPPEHFTAFFASARIFGYLAHFLESRLDNRIVRPQAQYRGPAPRSLRAGESFD